MLDDTFISKAPATVKASRSVNKFKPANSRVSNKKLKHRPFFADVSPEGKNAVSNLRDNTQHASLAGKNQPSSKRQRSIVSLNGERKSSRLSIRTWKAKEADLQKEFWETVLQSEGE
jgi:hypothetical protein